MPAGLQILNADGVTVQIDDTYANLAVVEMGAKATDTATAAGGNSSVTFSKSGLKNPLIAVTGINPAGAVCWLQDASTGTWGFNITAGGAVGTQAKYLIFDSPPATATNFGFQVFDSHGNKTFDGSMRYLRVVDMQLNAVGPFSYDASKQYAVCHLRFGFRVWNQTGFNQVQGSTVSGGTVGLSYLAVATVPGSPAQLNQMTPSLLILDITNYGL
jgi:hypothetical protein